MKADLDAKTVDPGHESVGWDVSSLRWAWNRAKHKVAPWWAQNSKEAYSAGLADLAQALSNWSTSRDGKRRGRRVGFPRRIPGSRGWTTAKAKLVRLDRRCVHLRREAAHQLTTELAGAYGHIVIEDLDVAAMTRGMGRRAFRRAASDASMGAIKPCWCTRPPATAGD